MKYQKDIDEWIYLIHGNHLEHCKDIELSLDNNVIPALERKDAYIDSDRIEKGFRLEKYLPFKLLPWERYQFALISGLYLRCPGAPYDDIYFHEIRDIIGRGSGKNGFIDFLALYLLSPYHGIKGYNIDLIANGEQQALTSFDDLNAIVKNPVKEEYRRVLAANYKALAQSVTGIKTGSVMRLNTTSTNNKDSKRTGCIIIDEEHQYLKMDNINTLITGLGKKRWGRTIKITSDGIIRGGVLDREKEENEQILHEWNEKNRVLVNWFRIEKESEWNDTDKLVKAIPSLKEPSFFALRTEIDLEIEKMPTTPELKATYMAKRCNFPIGDRELQVTDWANAIACTRKPSFELKPGMACVGALDYTKTNDFVGCIALFRKGDEYATLHHTFICSRSANLEAIRKRVPIDDWIKQGICEIVQDVEVPPELVAGWFGAIAQKYSLLKIGIDDYRYTLMNKALKQYGFDASIGKDKKTKNVWLCRRSDDMKIAPTIISMLDRKAFSGWDRMLCWYENNTKQVRMSGNITFDKIEPALRKTDGFIALVHAMCVADELPDAQDMPNIDLGVYTY